jgi:hypothetical protein
VTGPVPWRRLRDGADGRVLAVDFAAPGRTEAGFADLAGLLGAGPEIWETTQPSGHAVRPACWFDGPSPDGRPVEAVLGYCVGSVYAAQIVEHLRAGQAHAPRLLLFDPEPADAAGMLGELRRALAGLGQLMTAEERAQAHRRGERVAAEGSLAEVSRALAAEFERAAGPALQRAGVLPRVGEELTAMFAAVMAYIRQAADFDVNRGWADATALCSRPAGAAAGAAARVVTFDVARDDLLRSQVVAAEVDRALTARAG